MKIVNQPRVYLVGRQIIDDDAVERFLAEHETTWSTDSEVGAEALCEMAGRVSATHGHYRGSASPPWTRSYVQNRKLIA